MLFTTQLMRLLTLLWVSPPLLPFAAGGDAIVGSNDHGLDPLTGRVELSSSSTQWPIENDGQNDVVEWDHYSIFVNGKRLFLFTGEFHYWRLPVPEMWRDILGKIKAAGFTGFTFYSSWGYHAFNSTSVDFETGAHDIGRLFQLAKDVGLYIILRPGPYINAEANAGGFPLWLTTGAYGALRNNGTLYKEAYTPYLEAFSEAAKPYLISNGGNAILYQVENEYGDQWIGNPKARQPDENASAYMQDLINLARRTGINVPLDFNNPNMDTYSWSNEWAPGALGNTDLSGVDSYPSCWTCDLSQCASTNGPYVPYKTVDYYSYFQSFPNTTQPNFLPEFQGGSFNPWGGPQGGCPADIGPDFANLFYRHNIAARVTAFNLYMMYGGTNWGSFAAPVVATSYDYSAPIQENRALWDKFSETKLLALFTRAATDLTKTERLRNSTSLTTSDLIDTTELRNPTTNGAFYIIVHANSSSGTKETFKLHVNTTEGPFVIPQHETGITLNGHQSKILVTDFVFGTGHLIYSTAEALSFTTVDGTPTLFLWVPDGESVEFYLKGVTKGQHANGNGCNQPKIIDSASARGTIVSFAQATGMSVFTFESKSSGKSLRVVVMDRSTAYTVWFPPLSSDPVPEANETVFVQGPYLVRKASFAGNNLSISGDSLNATEVEIFGPQAAKSVVWNGRKLDTSKTSYGSLKAQLAAVKKTAVQLPSLSKWKSANSLPEIMPGYDDSGPAWVDANHTTTPNPTKPSTLPVLYADDYGFGNGVFIWRGAFDGTSATGVDLNLIGGYAFGWSAWLNGHLVGSFLGNASLEIGNRSLAFDSSQLRGHNMLVVVQDNTGHDETPTYLNPRGILKAKLQGGSSFTSWKVAGTAGGTTRQLDPVRGPLAEGGLYAERLGWHLPGFDDSSWSDTSSPATTGLSAAGIRFYRTVVPLSMPPGLDVSISFRLSAMGSPDLRAQLFVNGYQYGRFNPHIGHQIEFPVPPGVLDYSGDNTIGLSVWAQTDAGAKVGIEWQINYIADSSLDVLFNSSYLRPGWTADRLAYA